MTIDVSLELLDGVYPLPHRQPKYLQCEGFCDRYLDLFSSILSPIWDQTTNPPEWLEWCTEDDLTRIRSCRAALERSDPSIKLLKWLPRYGSAVVAHAFPSQNAGTVSMVVIGLDQYKFALRGTNPGQSAEYDYVSNARSFVDLGAGTLLESDLDQVMESFEELLAEAGRRKGSERSAGSNAQGHQFTPAMIHALLTQAISRSGGVIRPKGGFTDCGNHTGGHQSNTSFPLARSYLHWLLKSVNDSENTTFQKLMLYFDLRVIQERIDPVGARMSRTATDHEAVILHSELRIELDCAMAIMAEAAVKFNNLHELNIALPSMLQVASGLESQMRKTLTRIQDKDAASLAFEDVEGELSTPGAFRNPKVSIDAESPWNAASGSPYDVIALTRENIGLINVLETTSASLDWGRLLAWTKEQFLLATANHAAACHFTSTIEHCFWERAEQGLESTIETPDVHEPILEIINRYRTILYKIRTVFDPSHPRMTEINSREVLMTWVSYCIIFKINRDVYSCLSGVGVCLQWEELRHLVLPQRRLLKITHLVKNFLASHYVKEEELFSLRYPNASTRIGETFAREHLHEIEAAERRDAETRASNYWKKVVEKKNTLDRLRKELRQLKIEQDTLQRSHDRAQSDFSKSQYYDRNGILQYGASERSERDHLSRMLSSKTREVLNKENEIVTANVAPPQVVQPVPRDESLALSWLFYLHMPPPLRTLQTLSFIAQQTLGPPSSFDKLKVDSDSPRASITAHYNHWKENKKYIGSPCDYKGVDGHVQLVGASELTLPVPKEHLDQIMGESDGVFYPSWRTRMAWFGGPSAEDCRKFEFDPFLISESTSLTYFAEPIGKDYDSCQWMMVQDGSRHHSRGNLPLATQDVKPLDFPAHEYLTLGKLRSYPFVQLRHLLVALAEGSISLDNPVVKSLVCQLVYHVGSISETSRDESGSFPWKVDLYQGDFTTALRPVLTSIAHCLCETPTLYERASIISELASFFSCWDDSGELRDIARRLSRALREWASGLDEEINNTSDLGTIVDLKIKKCQYERHATLCLASGPTSPCDDEESLKDVGEIVRLTVACHNASLLELAEDESLRTLGARCLERLYDRLDKILHGVRRRPELITQALGQVVKQRPTELDWKELPGLSSDSSCCFAAVAACGTHYSVNVITGVILVNGLPPAKLPLQVRQHRLYLEVFGEMDFDVIHRAGTFETISPVHEKQFNFRLVGEELLVKEVDLHTGARVDLLDHGTIETWGAELPQRLKTMHHFWVYEDRSVVILREKDFRSRAVKFALEIQWETDFVSKVAHVVSKLVRERVPDPAVECIVYPMPADMQGEVSVPIKLKSECHAKHAEKLKLPSADSCILRILQKFESRRFIHTIDSNGTCRFELPRFQLSFEHSRGHLIAREFRGFRLAQDQMLRGSLHGFSRYLVMESTGPGPARLCLLLPEGGVARHATGFSTIEGISTESDAALHFHMLSLHPRYGTLHGTSTLSMLRVAALHAATSMEQADDRMGVKGSERALELIRQCFTTSPLAEDEKTALMNVYEICGGRFPAIRLACLHLYRSSEQVSFLFNNMNADSFEPTLLEFPENCDDASCYIREIDDNRCSPRMKLTDEETGGCFGVSRGPVFPRRIRSSSCCAVAPETMTDIQKAAHVVQTIEGNLRNLLVQERTLAPQANFPLHEKSQQSCLGRLLNEELGESWRSYQTTLSLKITPMPDARDKAKSLLKKTSETISNLEQLLVAAFNVTDLQSPLRFFKLAGMMQSATRSDFTRILYDRPWIASMNPLLSQEEDETLFGGILNWHRLCVLEDKLNRLASHSQDDDDEFVRELKVTRCFDVVDNPSWLAFEVENQLQIRPEQTAIAQHLIDSPGDIVQLNMGLGKTRVIVPMLILHWTTKRESGKHDRITRLNVLSNLFHEAKDYYRPTLTASIARIRVFTLPFCRDVVVDTPRVTLLRTLLKQCRESRGFFLASPEHRLSLELKSTELERADMQDAAGLLRRYISHSSNWREILDESDELLHHRFRLTYATGDVDNPPEADRRYRMPQFLLMKMRTCTRVRQWIENNGDALIAETESVCEVFPPVRINGEKFSETKSREMRELLANSILCDPPYELDWMKDHPALVNLRRFVVDPGASSDLVSALPNGHLQDLFVLRGLLAGDVLFHCLQKRHRVEFGINRNGKKRIAIPFRAADVPAPRSEFAHPDCAIILSCLAYYSDGLDESKLVSTFESLLRQGKDSRHKQYSSWYELSKGRMIKAGDADRLDSVDKIDLTNRSQLKKLMDYYRRNVETINYFLRHIVFRSEMRYFPARMTATSWNLAENDGRQVVGFSGTNDNHRILPKQVRQYFFDPTESAERHENAKWLEMHGTNGLMVARILDHTVDCVLVSSDVAASVAVLSVVESRIARVGVLIDAGALLAGVENDAFASQLVRCMRTGTSRYKGVTFFDSSKNKWSIMDVATARILSIERSPISVDDTFAFFDEPRCRGADLKLRADEIALLTLGPKMSKDKFMQGAGRMRKLGGGQKLIIAGTQEVMSQACFDESAPVRERTKAVIAWTIKNTVESNALGLLPWATQGFFHATSHGYPSLTVEPESAGLKELYGSPFVSISTQSAVAAAREHYENRRRQIASDAPLEADRLSLMREITDVVNSLGCMVLRSSNGVDEECEREFELQREMEEQSQREIARMIAAPENDWDISAVLTQQSPGTLPEAAVVLALSSLAQSSLSPASLGSVAWPGSVYVTGNFWRSVLEQTSEQVPKELNSYHLRLVDGGLFFPKSGEVLLLSERETDAVVELMYNAQAQSTTYTSGARLFHLSLVRRAVDGTVPGLRPEMMVLSAGRRRTGSFALPDSILACLQLFAGDTVYATSSQKAALKAMLVPDTPPGAQGAAGAAAPACDEPLRLVEMRGFSQCYPYSDLEQVCKEVAREAEADKFRRTIEAEAEAASDPSVPRAEDCSQ